MCENACDSLYPEIKYFCRYCVVCYDSYSGSYTVLHSFLGGGGGGGDCQILNQRLDHPGAILEVIA